MAKLNTLQLGDKIYDSFPDKEARQAIENFEVGSAAIIDVLELPTEDINRQAIYRLTTTAKFVSNGDYVFDNWVCYCVNGLPAKGEPVSADLKNNITAYYNIQDNEVYGYADDMISTAGGVPIGWHPLNFLAQPFKVNWGGIITDLSEIDDSVKVLVNSTYYIYQGEWCELPFAYEKAPVFDIQWDGNMDGRITLDMSVLGYDQGTYCVYISDNVFTTDEMIGWTYKLQWHDDSYEEPYIIHQNSFDTTTYPGAFIIGDWITVVYDADILAAALGVPSGIYPNGIYFLYNDNGHIAYLISPTRIIPIDRKFLPNKGQGYNAEIFNDYERNRAIGDYSHAEGTEVTAIGYASHAEGLVTRTEGEASHAEGKDTRALGYYSHAEGEHTRAKGNYSHAEGCYTVATGENQHVQGRHNIEDTENNYAHIVGNGEFGQPPSNAHTLDWNGNAWFAGDVYIGGTSQDDPNAKRLGASVLPDPANARFNQCALVSKNGIWALSDDPIATLLDFNSVSQGISAAQECIKLLETDVERIATHADYAYNAVISLGPTVDQTIKPKLTSLEAQMGSINTALDYIIDIQNRLTSDITLISFTINDTEYQAKEGMTWYEWVKSEYDKNDWELVSDGEDGYYIARSSDNWYAFDPSAGPVKGSWVIKANYHYELD